MAAARCGLFSFYYYSLLLARFVPERLARCGMVVVLELGPALLAADDPL